MEQHINSIRFLKSDLFLLVFWLFTSIIPNYTLGYLFYFILGFVSIIKIGIKFYNFQPGLIMIIFISTYLFYLIPVFFFDVNIASHTEYTDHSIYLKTLKLFIFFLVVFNLFLKKVATDNFIINKSLNRINSIPLFFIFYSVQIFILIYGSIKGQQIIGKDQSYEIYASNLENQNGLWEYFYIVFFLSYFFTTSRKIELFLYFSFAIYCYLSFTRGYRIQMIEMIILFFILFFDGKFRNIHLILGSFFSLIIMEFFGILKTIGKFNSEQLINSFGNFGEIYLTNQTEVFYSTSTMLELANKNILDLYIRVETLFGFLINIIVPSGFMWQGSRLLDYIPRYAQIGGGGFCFGYVYFWLGYLGIILLSMYLGKLFSSLNTKKNWVIFFIILTTSICPRWFAYEPTNHLLRMQVLLVAVYLFVVINFKKKHEIS